MIMKLTDVSALLHVLILVAVLVPTFAPGEHEARDSEVPQIRADNQMITFDKYSVSVTSNITVNVGILPEARVLTIIPNGVTIEPLGPTTVVFEVIGMEINSSSMLPITFLVPTTAYLNSPITGTVAQTVMIRHGSSVAVQGLITSITRELFGFSWQTFPQLRKVVISQFSPDWPFPLAELSSFEIPSLI